MCKSSPTHSLFGSKLLVAVFACSVFVSTAGARLAGTVFCDENGNGLREPGEPGIPGVKVTLCNLFKITDANGDYSFSTEDLNSAICNPAPYPYIVSVDVSSVTGDCNVPSCPTTVMVFSTPAENVNFCFQRCVGKIGDFVWDDKNGNGCQDAGEPGIPNVQVDLYLGCGPNKILFLTTFTDADGKYLFDELCAGNYTVSFTTPTGYTRTLPNQACAQGGTPSDERDSDCDCGSGDQCGVCVTLPTNSSEDLTIDCGYLSACNLSVIKQCIIPPPAPEPFDCSGAKPITTMVVRWNGATSPIWVRAWNGAIGGSGVAQSTFGPIAIGQTVTFTRSGTFPNDIFFEIFSSSAMTAATKLGNSTFHLSCSDVDMNGPEDCGKAAGDGKALTGFLNQWIFDGMAGNGKVLACTPAEPTASTSCNIPPVPLASCETLGKPTSLTFLYTGAGCGNPLNNNPQSGKFICSGSVGGQIFVRSLNGYTISPTVVNPGETFTVSGSFAAQSIFVLSNNVAGGSRETNSIHTSCSQLLAVGDVFGDLTLVGFNGQTGGSTVTYRYTVANNGASALNNIFLTDDKLGDIAGPFSLAAGASVVYNVTVTVSGSVDNIATVYVLDAQGNATCTAVSEQVTVNVSPPCPIWANAATISARQLKRSISNTGPSKTTITGVTLTWPAVNGKLMKVKLDGDVLWDIKSPAGATSITLNAADLTTDVKKKSIDPGDTRVFTLEFERDALTDLSAYTLTVSFGTCSLTIP